MHVKLDEKIKMRESRLLGVDMSDTGLDMR